MADGVLDAAYRRLHGTGPEWGEGQLVNHAPMAVEVMVRRGHAAAVDSWVAAYARRLDDPPTATAPVTGQDWREALGDGRRVTDWTAYFAKQVEERPWREVLATWWPRLLPGIAAGMTHGVIRVGHVTRVLLAGVDTTATRAELAHALGLWAARARPLLPAPRLRGPLLPAPAIDALPRLDEQDGAAATRLRQVSRLAGWTPTVAALSPGATPEEARVRLAELVTAATVRYLTHGHGHPALLVHTATAPNAVLHTLPALPEHLWSPSLAAIWTVTAAVISACAPAATGPRTTGPPSADQPAPDAVAELVDRAVTHADEHVIKFADTAAEVYTRTGDTRALAAAERATTLIPPRGR